MKVTSKTLLLLAGLAFLLAGCQKEGRFGSDKHLIRFTAAADAQTKASYSGETADGFERINWEEGDQIRIWSPQAVDRYQEAKHYADYKVSEITEMSGRYSRAKIVNAQDATGNPSAPENDNANGLIWGDPGEYTFYASYPITPDGTMGKIKGNIPAQQTLLEHTYSSGTIYEPDMTAYGYMTAMATVTTTISGEGPSGGVNLNFDPAFTAFEFKVLAGADDDVELSSFTIETLSDDSVMAGDFVIDCATKIVTPGAIGGSSSVTVDLSGHSVSEDNPLTFTVFALPIDLTNLKITLVGDKIGTRSLLLNDKNGTAVPFTACHKYKSTLRLPNLLWTSAEDLIWDLETVGQDLIWDN